MRALTNAFAPGYGRLVNSLEVAASQKTFTQWGAALSRRVLVAHGCVRSSSSNSRWKQRQQDDHYSREAKVFGLKSRAAFKLLELDAKHKLFKKGQTVVDLGYAPGSWSQVAVERTKPGGRVIGIDIIPVQPPKGVSAIQGNFLLPAVHTMVKDYLAEFAQRKSASGRNAGATEDEEEAIIERPSYIDAERAESADSEPETGFNDGKLVDVVLSDMMMNTSGMFFRDHASSMDLCLAALKFASDTLRAGGHFVCKFYQGEEDKKFESILKKMFGKVSREKPDASRSESREGYFVATRRKGGAALEDVI